LIDYSKRKANERKFPDWEELPDDGRRYFFEVEGRNGWKARYVKEVDKYEETQKFYQEIYDDQDRLVEIHIKFPIDQGHVKLG
jgi:hypothetical protein